MNQTIKTYLCGFFMMRVFVCMLAGLCACRSSSQSMPERSPDMLRLMFYNLENYFEAKNDSLHPKREFAPSGKYHWTKERFNDKTQRIAKTIIAVGAGMPPDLIGMCEVENRRVLERLYYDTPLAKHDYGIVHQESPDRRGIDVALLYRKSTFALIGSHFFRMNMGKRRTTRDILYAKGMVGGRDTLHVMVVHAPSKYGGALSSEPSRRAVAAELRRIVDSLNRTTRKLFLVVMGDFNDFPDSESVQKVLQASSNLHAPHADTLYNLAMPLHKQGRGSIKYRRKWQLIDLALVSGSLLNARESIYCLPQDYRIFNAAFLLERDGRRTDSIPRRTYKGMRYNPGGISDHLPITLDIRRN